MASNKIDLEIGGNFVIWIGVVLFAGYQVKLVSDGKLVTIFKCIFI